MNAVPVSGTMFEFESVIVSVDVPPTAIDVGEKLLATVGAANAETVSVALAGAVLGGALDVTAPAAIVFEYELGAGLVTVTVTVQLPLAGIVPPESAREPLRGFAVTVPPHDVIVPGTAALTRPAG